VSSEGVDIMFRPRKRFRTKLIIVAGVGLAAGFAASVAAALVSVSRLSIESTRVVEDGLNSSTREYLATHIVDTARQTNVSLATAFAEVEALADVAQTITDHQGEMDAIGPVLAHQALFKQDLRLVVGKNGGLWYENPPSAGCTIGVWREQLDTQQRIRPEALRELQRTQLLDLFLPVIARHGATKQWVYYVGPPGATFVRNCPWNASYLAKYDELYPGKDHDNWWTFFPGLLDAWERWAATPDRLQRMPTQTTVSTPYQDAGGAGMMITIFHPVWRRDRHTFAGSANMDITLSQITDSVERVRLAKTGFAFLAQPNGNVLAVNSAGEQVLGLETAAQGGPGVSILRRSLRRSSQPSVTGLHLPQDDEIHFEELTIGAARHIVVLKRLAPFLMWSGTAEIKSESWTLGFVVPELEVYEPLQAARAAIERRGSELLRTIVALSAVTLALVLLGLVFVSRRITNTLGILAERASDIMRGNYGERVGVDSHDEIGALATAFNAMADKVQAHTEHLEGIVAERTDELRRANEEISQLNERLQAENIRLGAELDIARQLQSMVLPQASELREIQELEIAAYMRPANEVGGDYYDVLRTANGIEIGIGDVTGHGLESGVLMLMIQTAIRTLIAAEESDPSRILRVVNRVIYGNIQRSKLDHSATLSLLSYRDGTLTITGQHEEAIVVRRSGDVIRMDTIDLGFPVGIEFDIGSFLSVANVQLEVGDVVVLYTDGITEAENLAKEQYGLDRLCRVAQRHRASSAHQIKDAVVGDITRYIGRHPVLDDITLVVLKVA